ncbi:hypothetical protein AMK16_00100 [Streptomyces sp. CB00455]|uniref:hypothetical protein n=1 Tax=Streptomyces sp. CB00455 TaxID=1703927 RepID=UPI00093E6510|nr:hypothetical protein [Streptomyces sp. CB00455]OKK21752.1 hypothetical protein AMK16_00100 [Streptomyces sp. CB00455]
MASLADATARWKAASPPERFRYRGVLRSAAVLLEPALSVFDVDFTHGLDHALTSSPDLDRATELARDIVRAQPVERALEHPLVRALARDFALARHCARPLAGELYRARDLASDRDSPDRVLALDRALELYALKRATTSPITAH